ncbi:MAG: GAF domain-containing protein [Oscillospiraceae bacterium]|nr:GAF domain-containing protein [Oscillospiraceae bacterium]MDD5920363.1 GAF domain-containing protein [Oscillospiraceae bacterium]
MQTQTTDYPADKKQLYPLLISQLSALVEGVPHRIANLANASALLMEALDDINWAGFYLMEEGRLVLGPFQGRPACIEIPVGKGVCGTAVEKDEILLVENVHDFPGHIACDSASNSEIVLPLHAGQKVVGVLDIDSPVFARFDEEDRKGLACFARIVEKMLEENL